MLLSAPQRGAARRKWCYSRRTRRTIHVCPLRALLRRRQSAGRQRASTRPPAPSTRGTRGRPCRTCPWCTRRTCPRAQLSDAVRGTRGIHRSTGRHLVRGYSGYSTQSACCMMCATHACTFRDRRVEGCCASGRAATPGCKRRCARCVAATLQRHRGGVLRVGAGATCCLYTQPRTARHRRKRRRCMPR